MDFDWPHYMYSAEPDSPLSLNIPLVSSCTSAPARHVNVDDEDWEVVEAPHHCSLHVAIDRPATPARGNLNASPAAPPPPQDLLTPDNGRLATIDQSSMRASSSNVVAMHDHDWVLLLPVDLDAAARPCHGKLELTDDSSVGSTKPLVEEVEADESDQEEYGYTSEESGKSFMYTSVQMISGDVDQGLIDVDEPDDEVAETSSDEELEYHANGELEREQCAALLRLKANLLDLLHALARPILLHTMAETFEEAFGRPIGMGIVNYSQNVLVLLLRKLVKIHKPREILDGEMLVSLRYELGTAKFYECDEEVVHGKPTFGALQRMLIISDTEQLPQEYREDWLIHNVWRINRTGCAQLADIDDRHEYEEGMIGAAGDDNNIDEARLAEINDDVDRPPAARGRHIATASPVPRPASPGDSLPANYYDRLSMMTLASSCHNYVMDDIWLLLRPLEVLNAAAKWRQYCKESTDHSSSVSLKKLFELEVLQARESSCGPSELLKREKSTLTSSSVRIVSRRNIADKTSIYIGATSTNKLALEYCMQRLYAFWLGLFLSLLVLLLLPATFCL